MRTALVLTLGALVACVDDPVFVGDTTGAGASGGSTSSGQAPTATATSIATSTATTSTGAFMGTCGDGFADASEACDDGNVAAGDGCSPACTLEATCGNGIVEPGEPCDGGLGCDACTIGPLSVCSGAQELPFGTATITPSGPYPAFDDGTCGDPILRLGWIDVGSIPMRLLVRSRSGAEQNDVRTLIRHGCTGAVVEVCDDSIITPVFPAHSILWLGSAPPATYYDVEIQAIRFGTFFETTDGFVASQTLPSWVYSASNTAWQVTGDSAGVADLDSPALSAVGLAAVELNFDYQLSIGGGGNTLEVLSSIDGGATWASDALLWATIPENTPAKVPLRNAAGQPDVRIRYRFTSRPPNGFARIANTFFGPPFAP